MPSYVVAECMDPSRLGHLEVLDLCDLKHDSTLPFEKVLSQTHNYKVLSHAFRTKEEGLAFIAGVLAAPAWTHQPK